MGNTEAIKCWRLVSSDLGVTKQTHVPLFCSDEVETWPMNITPSFKKAMRSFQGSQCLFAKRRYPSSEHTPLTSATARQMLPGLYSFPRIGGILLSLLMFYCRSCISLSSLQTQYFKTWCFRAGSDVSRLFHQHLNVIPGTCFIRLCVSGSNMCNTEVI